MTNFIPANSRVAVQNVKPGSKAQWYTTKKDVDVPVGVKTVRCPIRADRDVDTFTHDGFHLFYLPGQVRVRLDAAMLNTVANVRLSRLEYDIPETSTLVDGHPSNWLWRYGVRTTKSCWMIPEDRVPAILERLNNLTEAGVVWDLTKNDVSETPKLIGQCVQALQREVAAAVARAAESQTRAAAQLDATPAEDDPNAAQKRFLKRAEAIKKRTDELFVELEAAAAVFGIDVRTLGIARAATAVVATRTAMVERARLFVAARDAAAALNTRDGNAVAAALTAGEMPVEIAADFLEDNGQTEIAHTVRSAFAGEPETFSLTDDAGD